MSQSKSYLKSFHGQHIINIMICFWVIGLKLSALSLCISSKKQSWIYKWAVEVGHRIAEDVGGHLISKDKVDKSVCEWGGEDEVV